MSSAARRTLQKFWFVPAVVAGTLAALAFPVVALDRALGSDEGVLAFGGDPSAGREILGVITGSIITVAGLTFSLTMVTLQLVSGQFSPRSIPTLLADRTNQFVAGWFLGVFAYGLLVMRTIRAPADPGGTGEFVPGLAVTVGIALGLSAVGVLLLFIHHLANSLKVSSILSRIAHATLKEIDRLPGGDVGTGPLRAADGPSITIRPARPGFVERVDAEALARALEDRGAHVSIVVTAGQFVTPGSVLAVVAGATVADQAQYEGAVSRVRAHVPVVDERTMDQDVGYGLRQLTDIALRALSPGIHDPTTADTAIRYLGAALERLAQRPLARVCVRRCGETVVVARARSFEEYLAGLDEIMRAATPDVQPAIDEALAAVQASALAAGRPSRATAIEAAIRRIPDEGRHATRPARQPAAPVT